MFDFDQNDLVRKMFGAICLNVLLFRCEKSDCNEEYAGVYPPCLKMARKGDLSFMKNEMSAHAFLLYLVNQGFRGPDYLKSIGESLPDGIRADGGTAELAQKN